MRNPNIFNGLQNLVYQRFFGTQLYTPRHVRILCCSYSPYTMPRTHPLLQLLAIHNATYASSAAATPYTTPRTEVVLVRVVQLLRWPAQARRLCLAWMWMHLFRWRMPPSRATHTYCRFAVRTQKHTCTRYHWHAHSSSDFTAKTTSFFLWQTWVMRGASQAQAQEYSRGAGGVKINKK